MLLQRVLTRSHSLSLSRALPPVQTRQNRGSVYQVQEDKEDIVLFMGQIGESHCKPALIKYVYYTLMKWAQQPKFKYPTGTSNLPMVQCSSALIPEKSKACYSSSRSQCEAGSIMGAPFTHVVLFA